MLKAQGFLGPTGVKSRFSGGGGGINESRKNLSSNAESSLRPYSGKKEGRE